MFCVYWDRPALIKNQGLDRVFVRQWCTINKTCIASISSADRAQGTEQRKADSWLIQAQSLLCGRHQLPGSPRSTVIGRKARSENVSDVDGGPTSNQHRVNVLLDECL